MGRLALFKIFGRIQEGCLLNVLSDSMVKVLEGDDKERGNLQPVLLIASRGGNLEEALMIYNFLRQVPQPLITIGLGFVESAATIVYLAGTKRYATPETVFMFHEGTHSIHNVPPSELNEMVKQCELNKEYVCKILAKSTGIPYKRARRWIQKRKVLKAEDALKEGVVHQILESSLFEGADVNVDGIMSEIAMKTSREQKQEKFKD